MTKRATCEKTARFGNNVNHSHRRSNRTWKVNAKSIKAKTEGGVRKMYTCTFCLCSNFVEKA